MNNSVFPLFPFPSTMVFSSLRMSTLHFRGKLVKSSLITYFSGLFTIVLWNHERERSLVLWSSLACASTQKWHLYSLCERKSSFCGDLSISPYFWLSLQHSFRESFIPSHVHHKTTLPYLCNVLPWCVCLYMMTVTCIALPISCQVVSS